MAAVIKGYVRDLYYYAVSVIAQNEQTAEIDGTKAYFYCQKPDEYKDFYKFSRNFSEKKIIKKIIKECNTGDTFYDIGAKVGVYSCFLGQAVTDVDLTLFEPHPNNARRCRKNLEINGLRGEVREQIVGDRGGKTELYLQTPATGVGTHSTVARSEKSIPVETVTLDELIKDCSPPDIIKIDVEGAENKVISGMERILYEHPPRAMIIEVHHELIQDDAIDTVYKPLRSAGYDLQEIDRQVDRPKTTALWAEHQET